MITRNDQELILKLTSMVEQTNRYIQIIVENHCERWELTPERFNYFIHAYYRGYYNYWQSEPIREVIDYISRVQDKFRTMLRATLEHYDSNLVLHIGKYKDYDLPQLAFRKSMYCFRFERMFHESNWCTIFTDTTGKIIYNSKDNLLSTFFKEEYTFKLFIDEYEEDLNCTQPQYQPCFKTATHIIPSFHERDNGDWDDGHIYVSKISPRMYAFPEHIKEELRVVMSEKEIARYNYHLVEVL